MMLLSAAWLFWKILSVGSLVVALSGVAVFGWHFVRINAQAGRKDAGEIPRESWRGKGAMLGLKILGLGVILWAGAIALGAVLPSQP
jgi:hypothetical protein